MAEAEAVIGEWDEFVQAHGSKEVLAEVNAANLEFEATPEIGSGAVDVNAELADAALQHNIGIAND